MGQAVATPYASGHLPSNAATVCARDELRPGGNELTRRAIDCAGFAAGADILDLGCGSGAGSRLLRRHGCRVIALDHSHQALTTATRRLAGLESIAADACRLPLSDASIGGILAECSLSLAGYASAALAECLRVLRPGGRLAITDVYARDPSPPPAPESAACLGHLAGRDAILAALARAGLRIERWEDHSALLKRFIAQLIMNCGSTDTLWGGNPELGEKLRQQRPGYFLLIAAKAAGRN